MHTYIPRSIAMSSAISNKSYGSVETARLLEESLAISFNSEALGTQMICITINCNIFELSVDA